MQEQNSKTKKAGKGFIGDIEVYCSYDELKPINEVKENPDNPNSHPPPQLELLAKIIKSQGWRAAIIISRQSGLIVRGHGRYQAARLLGLPSVPVEYQDYNSYKDERADLLADNMIAEMAELDLLKLDIMLSELATEKFDLSLAGIDESAFNARILTPEEAFSILPTEEKDFFQMTFVLHKSQKEIIERAIEKARKVFRQDVASVDKANSNGNGNALYLICRQFLEAKPAAGGPGPAVAAPAGKPGKLAGKKGGKK